jgi:hypothetical protein
MRASSRVIDNESKLMNQTTETPDRKLAPEPTEVIVWDEPPEKIDQQTLAPGEETPAEEMVNVGNEEADMEQREAAADQEAMADRR